MDGYLSNKPDNFVDDPKKLYRLRRHEAQAKKLEFADPKMEARDRLSLQRNHHLKALGRIDFHRWEKNRSQSARSGSYAPRTSSTSNLEPRRDRKAVRDQDLNNPHGATFTLHR
jgi:hypothetical protein